MSKIDVKPDFQTLQSAFGASTSQTASSAHGLTRQMWAVPGVPGKPISWPTYAQPSGPIATVVGTASAGISGGRPGMRLSVDDLVGPARDRHRVALGGDAEQVVAGGVRDQDVVAERPRARSGSTRRGSAGRPGRSGRCRPPGRRGCRRRPRAPRPARPGGTGRRRRRCPSRRRPRVPGDVDEADRIGASVVVPRPLPVRRYSSTGPGGPPSPGPTNSCGPCRRRGPSATSARRAARSPGRARPRARPRGWQGSGQPQTRLAVRRRRTATLPPVPSPVT